MNNPETEFARELEVFENEIDEAMRCFYVWLTVHRLARENVKIFDFLNEYASFWNPALRALQANSIIALGCVFDRDQRSHSIDRLLQIAEQNSMMFSKAAIRRRKSTTLGADKWIDDFMQGVHVPAARDFRRLRRYVDARHKTYEKSYRNLRHKVFAHRDRNHVNASFRNATTRELGNLLTSLQRLHKALWHLFYNGQGVSLNTVSSQFRLRIAGETEAFLKALIAPRQRNAAPGRPGHSSIHK